MSGGTSILGGSSVQCVFPPFNSITYTVSVRGKTRLTKTAKILRQVCVCMCVCACMSGISKSYVNSKSYHLHLVSGERKERGKWGKREGGIKEEEVEMTLTLLVYTALVISDH